MVMGTAAFVRAAEPTRRRDTLWSERRLDPANESKVHRYLGGFPTPTHMAHNSLMTALQDQAQLLGDAPAITFLIDGETHEQNLSFADLDRRARAVAVHLLETCRPGDRALLLYAPDLEYVCGFLGCLYAGVIAVPAYPPDPGRLERTLPRLRAIVDDAKASVVLTTREIRAVAEMLFIQAPELGEKRWLATNDIEAEADAWIAPTLDRDTIAFIQYTSGSTGTPKGVVLTHGNLLQNLELFLGAFGAHGKSVGFTWLPPYHDMGLIGGLLGPLMLGVQTAFMSPISFLQRPLRWLEGISRFGATISGGPNFAYQLCVRRATPDDIAHLDLSSWEVAFSGAEPVRPETLAAFSAMFAPCGFRPKAFFPCYGLAEATLIVSGGRPSTGALVKHLDARELEQGMVVEADDGRPLVGCGTTLGQQIIRVVDPTTLTVQPDRRVGEICVSGASVAAAYWDKPELTAKTLKVELPEEPGRAFLRTGDLGFIDDGELFVTGRLKDVIIIRGRNFYPQDIERTAEESDPVLRRGCAAAFSLDADGQEWLCVAVELERRHRERRRNSEPPAGVERRGTDRREQPASMTKLYEYGAALPGPARFESVCERIRAAVAREHDIRPNLVVLVKAGSLPKTSSGKIQRSETRKMYKDGSLSVLEASTFDAPVQAPQSSDEGLSIESLGDTAATARAQRVANYLKELIAAGLRVPSVSVPIDVPVQTLGLESLTAVEIAHDVQQRFGALLPTTTLLRSKTIADVAKDICAALENDAPEVVRQEGLSSQLHELSSSQEALWFIQKMSPTSAAYNLHCAFLLEGDPADETHLRRAFELLVARHGVLRTQFRLRDDGRPAQRVLPAAGFEFESSDARDWSTNRLHKDIADRATKPFDLLDGELLRVGIYQTKQGLVVSVCSHHIVLDFWSLTHLLEDLRASFVAFRAGREPELESQARAITYQDFVLWQSRHLDKESASLWKYWKDALAKPIGRVDLPTDKSRPALQSFHGSARGFRIPKDTTDLLRTFARHHGVTPYVVLMSAFKVVLSRWSGTKDVIVGTPSLGRERAEFAHLVGLMINPFPVRTRMGPSTTFAQLVQMVRDAVLDGLDHASLPFLRLVQLLQPPRDPSRTPVFDVMFAFEQAPGSLASLPELVLGVPGAGSKWGDVAVKSFPTTHRTAPFDMNLLLSDGPDEMYGWLQYCSDLFEAATVERFADQFVQTLKLACAEPDVAFERLDLASARERALIDSWSVGPNVAYDDNLGIHRMVEAQTSTAPDRTAVAFGSTELTYRELDERANRLARALQEAGTQQESVVGVLLPRSHDLVVAHLGVLKAGAAFLPLDPELPPDRLAFMLEDSRAVAVITTSELQHELVKSLSVPTVDISESQRADRAASAPESTTRGRSLAYILYTSGSTGRPKGVAIEHRSVVSLLHHLSRHICADDIFAGVTTTSFDISVAELFLPLTVGARVEMLSSDEIRDARLLRSVLAKRNVTLMQGTPSLWQSLMEAGGPQRPFKAWTAGEPLPVALGQALLRNCKSLHNLYGPTETTVFSTEIEHKAHHDVITIGHPVGNTRLRILDANGNDSTVGVYGEIFIAGDGVARGYHRRPGLTAEKFLPDPHAAVPGARMYRTGDVARFRNDGRIEYVGRRDGQVKVRGFRIEIGEVEAALRSHGGVNDAAVIVGSAPGDGTHLVGFVTPRSDGVMPDDVKDHLRRRLPAYMVPAHLHVVESFPRTTSGKTDRKQLSSLAEQQRTPASSTKPRNEVEDVLVEAFRHTLEREDVGIHDNFFSLGGHSLLATRLCIRIEETTGFPVPVRAVFEAPTVAELAVRLGSGQKDSQKRLRSSAVFGAIPRSQRRVVRGAGSQKSAVGDEPNGGEQ